MNGLISRHGISLNRRLPEIRESFVKLIKQIIKRGKHLYERSTRYKLNPWIISVTSTTHFRFFVVQQPHLLSISTQFSIPPSLLGCPTPQLLQLHGVPSNHLKLFVCQNRKVTYQWDRYVGENIKSCEKVKRCKANEHTPITLRPPSHVIVRTPYWSISFPISSRMQLLVTEARWPLGQIS